MTVIIQANENKWFATLSAEEMNRLSLIADKVQKTVDDVVVTLARAKISIGKMLNEARELFPGDNEFGKWRAQAIPNLSPTDASYCMKAAATFGSAPELIEKMGWSAMRELTYAPPFLLNRLRAGEVPIPETKAEARDMVREAKASIAPVADTPRAAPVADDDALDADPVHVPRSDADAPPVATEKPVVRSAPPAGGNQIRVMNTNYPRLTIQQRWGVVLSMALPARLQHADGDPLLVLGLPPDTEMQYLNPMALDFVVIGLKTEYPLYEKDIEECAREVRKWIQSAESEMERDRWHARMSAEDEQD